MAEPKKERTFQAVLSDHQLRYLFNILGNCLAMDAMQKKAIKAGIEKLESFGSLDYSVETNIYSFRPTEKTWQYEFTEKELFGIKLACIQEITGLGQQKLPSTEGNFRYYLTPLIRAFGRSFEALVLKQAGPIMNAPEEEFKLELDPEPPPPPTPEESPKKEAV